MRTIKFRAWDEDSKNMIHFDLEHINYWDGQVDTGAVEYNGELKGFVNSKPLMQFTGLKDENGVEIYEGDIVRDLNHEAEGIVKFDEDGCDYNLVNAKNHFVQAFGLQDSIYEVVGNIYENGSLYPTYPLVTDLKRVPKGSIADEYKQKTNIALGIKTTEASIHEHFTPFLADLFREAGFEPTKPSLWQRIKRKVKR